MSYGTEKGLNEDINKLKDPETYKEKFATPEISDLKQAIDILHRLALYQFSSPEGSDIARKKLQDAQEYLEKQLKAELEKDK